MLAQKTENMERGQDARLMPMIVETLTQAGRAFADLDRIAVTRGPGSFTGARVGLAAARGIGLASGKPVIGIDRFSIYRSLHESFCGSAAAATILPSPSRGGNLLVVIDSKRAELFCRFYPHGGTAHEPNLMTAEQIKAFIAARPDTEIAGDKATPGVAILDACARLAANADPRLADFMPRPLYLRAPDVTFARSR